MAHCNEKGVLQQAYYSSSSPPDSSLRTLPELLSFVDGKMIEFEDYILKASALFDVEKQIGGLV